MKKIFISFLALMLMFVFIGCDSGSGSSKKKSKIDYENVADFEADLNEGKDLTGKVVQFTVDKYVPNSAFGYNMQTGEHLNFCSEKNPKVKEGDTVTVKVKEVSSMMGSYIISYEMK